MRINLHVPPVGWEHTEPRVPPTAIPGAGLKGWNLRETFAALRYPNYRLWFAGQLASLCGTWMQSTAQAFLVFELTRSPAFLGYVGFANGLPSWLLMLVGGVVADRTSRRNLMVLSQTWMMLLAFVLAALAFAGVVQPWHILLLAAGLGVANAFDAPARLALVTELVGREDLANAIALNSMMFNLAAVVGPAVAGITYALLGPAWCFAINGLSFLAVIAALLMMRLAPRAVRAHQSSVVDDLKEGLRYVASQSLIRTLIASAGVLGLFVISFVTLMPAWAVNILGGDATTNGWLQAARGVGALAGAFTVASLGRFPLKGKLMTLGMFVAPALLLMFSAVRWLPLALVVLAGVGWGMIAAINLMNALVQTQVTEELRGRAMSIYSLVFFGAMALGALLFGWLAELASEPAAVVVGALVALAFAVVLWLKVPQVRALE